MTDNGVIYDYFIWDHEKQTYKFPLDNNPDWVAIRGDKVVFLNKNGYDSEREHAARVFEEGQILTVDTVRIGMSKSYYKFKNLQYEYNTVMFEKLT